MKQLTEDEQYKIGNTIIGAALPLLPKGITWMYEGKGNDRATKKAIGSAAEEATREMHNEARDAEWEQAYLAFRNVLYASDPHPARIDALRCLREIRAFFLPHSQSLEEQIEAVLCRVPWSRMAGATQQEVAAEIAALVKERTGGTE